MVRLEWQHLTAVLFFSHNSWCSIALIGDAVQQVSAMDERPIKTLLMYITVCFRVDFTSEHLGIQNSSLQFLDTFLHNCFIILLAPILGIAHIWSFGVFGFLNLILNHLGWCYLLLEILIDLSKLWYVLSLDSATCLSLHIDLLWHKEGFQSIYCVYVKPNKICCVIAHKPSQYKAWIWKFK